MAFLGTLAGSAVDAYKNTTMMQDDLANSADNRRIKDDNHAMDMQERGLNYEKQQSKWTILSEIATKYQKEQEAKQKEISGSQQSQQPQPQSLQNGPPPGISPSGQITSGVGNSQQQPPPAQPFLQSQQAKPIPEIVKGMAQSVGGQSNGQADGPPAEQERQQASQGVPPNPKPYLASIKPDAAPTDPNSPIFQQVADVAARKADGVVPQEQTASFYQKKAQRDMKDAEDARSNAKAMMRHPDGAKDFSDQAKEYEKEARQATLDASKITSDNAGATNNLASSISDNPKAAPILLNKFREEHPGAYQQLVSQKDPKTGMPLFPAYDLQGNRRASEAGLEYLKAVAPESLTVKERADFAGKAITRQIAETNAKERERHDMAVENRLTQRQAKSREGDNSSGLTSEALDYAAAKYLEEGKIDAMYRDKKGREAVMNRAAKLAAERQISPSAAPAERAQFKANSAALTQITKDVSAIIPYKEMLDKNIDIAKGLAKKAIATDSKMANHSINWLKQNMTDNPDVSEYLAQMEFVKTESARVINNPRLVGQLTDSAKREMSEIMSGEMPLNSTVRVLDRVKADGKNRVDAVESQQRNLVKKMGGTKTQEVLPMPSEQKAENFKKGNIYNTRMGPAMWNGTAFERQ